jgi:hypothetical protein
MKLRERFASHKVKITSFLPTGSNSGTAEYDELDAEGNALNSGVAAVFDTNSVELDDDDCLTGNSRLSASGEFIVVRKDFDRTGLGRK